MMANKKEEKKDDKFSWGKGDIEIKMPEKGK